MSVVMFMTVSFIRITLIIIVVKRAKDSIEADIIITIFVITIVIDKFLWNVGLKATAEANQIQLFVGLIITHAALWLQVMLRSTKKSSLTEDSIDLEASIQKWNLSIVILIWCLC